MSDHHGTRPASEITRGMRYTKSTQKHTITCAMNSFRRFRKVKRDSDGGKHTAITSFLYLTCFHVVVTVVPRLCRGIIGARTESRNPAKEGRRERQNSRDTRQTHEKPCANSSPKRANLVQKIPNNFLSTLRPQEIGASRFQTQCNADSITMDWWR